MAITKISQPSTAIMEATPARNTSLAIRLLNEHVGRSVEHIASFHPSAIE